MYTDDIFWTVQGNEEEIYVFFAFRVSTEKTLNFVFHNLLYKILYWIEGASEIFNAGRERLPIPFIA